MFETSPVESSNFIIGIGSSAGGLEAIRELATNLPTDIGCAYVIVQHMSPQHKSLMTNLIASETELDVIDIADGMLPEPNVIYVTPPRADVIIKKGKLHLVEPSLHVGKPKPSVDRFLKSLAEERGERSMAIILSGTGSDGAYGVQAIREAGGITIAQDDVSAKYDGMSNAAIETGCIDLVLRPSQIGTHLKKILSSPGTLDKLKESSEVTTPITGILQIVLARTRVDFREYKQTTVQRRIERRMTALGIQTIEEYMSHCRNNPPEVDALFKDLLISVTRFFRDREEFEQLRAPIETLVEERKDQPLRIWVAGCATGEEVYSIAIMIAEAMGGPAELLRSKTQIFATDIDRAALDAARRGQYSQGALFDVPSELVSKYFIQKSDGVGVIDALRSAILFSDHNLCQDPPFLNMDLICCRNLLIYFGPKLQSRVLSRLHYAMKSHAYLFLGTAESVAGSDQLFVPINERAHIFKRRLLQKKDRYEPNSLTSAWSQPRLQLPNTAKAQNTQDATERMLFDALARSLGDNSVLVSADHSFLRVYGDLGPFVDFSEGSSLNLQLSLLKSPYREEARSLVTLALKHDRRRVGIRHITNSETKDVVRLEAMPVIAPKIEEKLALLIINKWTAEEYEALNAGGQPDSNAEVITDHHLRELDNELASTREALQQTIEELETSNEELQALNEELQSTNEELQATNEELETSNEELQSTNEELITVNEELQVNSSELTALNAELGSILGNVPIPLMVLDNALQISRASRAALELFSIPQPLTNPHLSQINLPDGFPRLVDICSQALQKGEPVITDFTSLGVTYTMQCAPFTGNSGQLIGTTIVLFRNPAMQSISNEFTQVLDHAPVHLIRYDNKGEIARISAETANAVGLSPDEAIGKNIEEIMSLSMQNSELNDLENILRKGTRSGVIGLYAPSRTTPTWVSANRFEFRDMNIDQTFNVIVGTDISQLTESERNLQQTNKSLQLIQKMSRIGHWRLDVITSEVFWSDMVFDIHGLDRKNYKPELVSAIDAYHPEDRDMVTEIVTNGMKDGKGWSFRARIVQPTGDVIWVESLADVYKDRGGTVTTIVGSFRDITPEKLIETRFTQIETLRTQKNNSFFSFDTLSNRAYWSPNTWGLLGLQSGAPSGFETVLKMVHHDDQKAFAKVHNDLMKFGMPLKGRYRIQCPGRDEQIISFDAQANKDRNGRVTDYFGTFTIEDQVDPPGH